MAKGYYLVIQDKTTCGGVITEGDHTHTLFGKAIAREQDHVTCGKHPGMFIIVGHIPGDSVMGRMFAGTLHSKSSCPCQARFIPSMVNDTYDLDMGGDIGATKERTSYAHATNNSLSSFTDFNYSGQTCDLVFPPLYSGVFLWTEIEGAGHAFVSIHVKGKKYLFTYGRYDQIGFSPVGDGVLIKYSDEKAESYYKSELYKMSANAFQITDIDEDVTLNVFNALWKKSDKKPLGIKTSVDVKENGRIIDKYDITGNNCTTTSVSGLKQSGTTIFNESILGEFMYSEDFVIPWSLNNHLIDMAHGTDMRVINVTNMFKDNFSNTTGIEPLEGAGLGNEAAGAAGKSSGTIGNTSSGISAGTSGGVLGSLND